MGSHPQGPNGPSGSSGHCGCAGPHCIVETTVPGHYGINTDWEALLAARRDYHPNWDYESAVAVHTASPGARGPLGLDVAGPVPQPGTPAAPSAVLRPFRITVDARRQGYGVMGPNDTPLPYSTTVKLDLMSGNLYDYTTGTFLGLKHLDLFVPLLPEGLLPVPIQPEMGGQQEYEAYYTPDDVNHEHPYPLYGRWYSFLGVMGDYATDLSNQATVRIILSEAEMAYFTGADLYFDGTFYTAFTIGGHRPPKTEACDVTTCAYDPECNSTYVELLATIENALYLEPGIHQLKVVMRTGARTYRPVYVGIRVDSIPEWFKSSEYLERKATKGWALELRARTVPGDASDTSGANLPYAGQRDNSTSGAGTILNQVYPDGHVYAELRASIETKSLNQNAKPEDDSRMRRPTRTSSCSRTPTRCPSCATSGSRSSATSGASIPSPPRSYGPIWASGPT